VLTIPRRLRDQIVAHARADHPDEACGVLAGPAGSDRPERFIPMTNAARSPTFYEFDSMELLQLYREMDDKDEEPVVIYHSHTATEAYPSRTDISLAGEPGAHYVLVSTRDEESAEFRSFRIVDGKVAEEPVTLVELFGAARGLTAKTELHNPTGVLFMAIEVRIPTILRTYTGGAKAVEGTGSTLAELFTDLDAKHGGLRDRLVDDAGLRRFVNVYLNDEDVRFLSGLNTPVKDGDTVTVLPAVAGGAG
jgi:proteasome lid subunit RPN8/RPN11/molybdopterin converting factor small subunit